MAVRVTQLYVNGFDDNFSYLLFDEASRSGFIVDPSGTFQRVLHAVDTLDLKIEGIILTHTHPDHYDALAEALERFPVPVYVGAPGAARISAPTIRPLEDGATLALGACTISVLHTPGHASDAICLFVPAQEKVPPQLISGDTLFVDGCGRTTPEAIEEMYASLQRLKALPPETVIYPGHDYGPTPTATLAAQRTDNPYLCAPDLHSFRERRLG